MVLTRLQEKKIHSDMTIGGSHPDAQWALEFEAKREIRMDKLKKTMTSLVTIVQELKDRLEADSSSSILIKRGINYVFSDIFKVNGGVRLGSISMKNYKKALGFKREDG
ncbi:hypothetical protein ZIOFF_027973 [Zingiber officinale]|uniref:Uncharacterized protein n=1 Tax=Zingiber officinale TaxID=94328 RepID=A0A8J5L374_ZINOF|nr:hypothetical protein ZIOFF_027973 [Zingiber officinale]